MDPNEIAAKLRALADAIERPEMITPSLREKQSTPGHFYARFGSPQWHAWNEHLWKIGQGGALQDRDGGWLFPIEWPP